MRALDLVSSAVGNSFRNKTRTVLTVVAIFIGAFTLTLTTSVGLGVNAYIDDTVAAVGADDVMTVSRLVEDEGDGPRAYDPDRRTAEGSPEEQGGPPGTTTVELLDSEDLDELRDIDGVISVEPVIALSVDYVEYDGRQYEIAVDGSTSGLRVQLAAGNEPDWDGDALEVALPVEHVEALGFADPEDAVGETVSFAVTDRAGGQDELSATVVGVAEPGLVGGGAATANDALVHALDDLRTAEAPEPQESAESAEAQESAGAPEPQESAESSASAESGTSAPSDAEGYTSASIRFDPGSAEGAADALRDRLAESGYEATTVADRLGSFQTVITGLTLVLGAFSVIALLASGFGIVNTLLMSVQERTREIGLMKAMGMGSGRVFGLFSLEAAFIGFLGSAIGAGGAIALGTSLNGVLADGLLSDLPGLTLMAFDPLTIAAIVAAIMAIAFLAGTVPALRAARQDPIGSLRHE